MKKNERRHGHKQHGTSYDRQHNPQQSTALFLRCCLLTVTLSVPLSISCVLIGLLTVTLSVAHILILLLAVALSIPCVLILLLTIALSVACVLIPVRLRLRRRLLLCRKRLLRRRLLPRRKRLLPRRGLLSCHRRLLPRRGLLPCRKRLLPRRGLLSCHRRLLRRTRCRCILHPLLWDLYLFSCNTAPDSRELLHLAQHFRLQSPMLEIQPCVEKRDRTRRIDRTDGAHLFIVIKRSK